MKTALIIDDDTEYLKVLGELLEHHGWRILRADDGEEGIRLARAHHPDLVLCDLLMPRCNGFHVCRVLRGDSGLRGMKIIMTSGRQYEADRLAALSAGADEYVVKPFNVGDLLTRLAKDSETKSKATSSAPSSTGAKRLPTTVRFWGVRGSIPTPGPTTVQYGGNTSCVEVRAGGQIIILDAGTGLRLLGRQLTEEFGEQPIDLTVLLTHTHWDHIQGLPFFLPVYQPKNHLRILGYEGARLGLDNVLSGQMESPFFPIALKQVPANVQIEELKDLSFKVGDVPVRAWYANHPGMCVGYRLMTSAGSVAFFPDNEPHSRHHHLNASEEEGQTPAREFSRREEEKMIEFLRGVDVLIMDSQYDQDEYQRHRGWGHGCLDDVVELALRAEARRLVLFHHDPSHDDAKISSMVEHARQIVERKRDVLEVEAAREGAVIELL